jgi:fermentation-respiration switch protein FrsA (DUF1100 family)
MQRPIAVRFVHWLLILLAIYALWLAFLYFQQETLIYPGAFFTNRPKDARLPQRTASVWVETTPGVRVEAWFSPGDGRSAANSGPAVLLTHGNAEWIDDTTWFISEYNRRGFSTLSCEYRGFGRSGGSPCQDGITADMIAFHDWLAARPEVKRGQIVFHGQSIGGGVVAQLAASRKPAALILQSTFSSLEGLTSRYLAPTALCKHPWRTDRVLPTLGRPILLLHGIQDSIIPVSHARALHRLAPGSELCEMKGEHNHFPIDVPAYWRAIDTFLARCDIAASSGK